jgi:hypothetical protein
MKTSENSAALAVNTHPKNAAAAVDHPRSRIVGLLVPLPISTWSPTRKRWQQRLQEPLQQPRYGSSEEWSLWGCEHRATHCSVDWPFGSRLPEEHGVLSRPAALPKNDDLPHQFRTEA